MSVVSRRLGTLVLVALIAITLGCVPYPISIRAQQAISHPTYISTTHNYSVTWDSPWFVVETNSHAGFDSLYLTDGVSSIQFIGGDFQGSSVAEIRDDFAESYASIPEVKEFGPMVDASGELQNGSESDSAYAYYEYVLVVGGNVGSSEEHRYVHSIEVVEIRDGVAVAIIGDAMAEQFGRYVPEWLKFANLVQPLDGSGSGEMNRIPERLNPGEIALIVQPTVSEMDKIIISEGVKFAQHYADGLFPAALSASLYVTAQANPHPTRIDLAGQAVGSAIVFYTGSEAWSSITALEKLGVVVHEYVHGIQHAISNGNNLASAAWFEEGFAEYVSVAAMASLTITDQSTIDAFYRNLSSYVSKSITLDELESHSMWDKQGAEVYPFSYFALGYLLEITGTGIADVARLYSDLSNGKSFGEAFVIAFGIPLTSFYERFEIWRDGWDPPGPIPQDYLMPTEGPPSSAVSFIEAPFLLVMNQQVLYLALSDPGADCRLKLETDRVGGALVDHSTIANGDGELFWLVTIPELAEPSLGTVSVSCGSVPDSEGILIAR